MESLSLFPEAEAEAEAAEDDEEEEEEEEDKDWFVAILQVDETNPGNPSKSVERRFGSNFSNWASLQVNDDVVITRFNNVPSTTNIHIDILSRVIDIDILVLVHTFIFILLH